MATEIKKISELSLATQFDGSESIPLLKGGSNPRATLGGLKEYFRDSSLVLFDEIDNASVSNIYETPLQREDGAAFAIVYLNKVSQFVERKTKGDAVLYSSSFTRSTDYIGDSGPRRDKVFFNISDKELYVFNGDLRNIFDTVRINAMTEEEFNKLENPIEGAFYATYEE